MAAHKTSPGSRRKESDDSREEPRPLSGWTHFFVFVLVVSAILTGFTVFTWENSGVMWLDLYGWFVGLGAASSFIVIAHLIFKRRSYAVLFAKILLVASLVEWIVLFAILSYDLVPPGFNFLFYLIWLPYLSFSPSLKRNFDSRNISTHDYGEMSWIALTYAILYPVFGFGAAIGTFSRGRQAKFELRSSLIFALVLSIVFVVFSIGGAIHPDTGPVPEEADLDCSNLCFNEGAQWYSVYSGAGEDRYYCECTDEQGVLIHQEVLAYDPNPVQPQNASTTTTRPPSASDDESEPRVLSASDIYEKQGDSLFLVENKCEYEVRYPTFDVDYEYDRDTDSLVINVDETYGTQQFVEELAWTGSGFLLDEALLTNNHVIDCDPDFVEADFKSYYDYLTELYYGGYYLNQSLIEEVDYDIENTVEEVYDHFYDSWRYDFYFERIDIEDLLVLEIAVYLSEHVDVTQKSRTLHAFHESDGFAQSHELTVQRTGASFPGKDYAVLSINTDKPSLDYDEQHRITIGEDVYVLGFPTLDIDAGTYDPADALGREPLIVTKGIVSSQRSSMTGANYYVLDAAAYYGSSGGPVLNERGEVIGLLTAGMETLTFVLPLSEVALS